MTKNINSIQEIMCKHAESNFGQFLTELFGNKPDGVYFNIWTAPNNKSKFFKDIDKAVRYIDKIKDKDYEIYIQTGMTAGNLGLYRRGKKKEIIGLPGFYMDIDIAGDNHEKTNLPPTITDAVALIKGHGIEPTLIVKSGHGIHAWWLFKEVLLFDDEGEQNEAEMINRRLQATIKTRAEEKGWELDSTFDRTRLLRIVGTYNRKDPDNPILVELYENTKVRYGDIADFDDYVIAEDKLQKASAVDEKLLAAIADNLEVSPNAAILDDKFQALIEIEPKVAETFEGQRKDFKKNSPSEHTLSLTDQAVKAGWGDQEICDLIVAFYQHNANNLNFPNIDPLKPVKRPGYVVSTIAKARSSNPNVDGKISINVKSRDLEKVNKQIFTAFISTNEPPILFNMNGNIIRLNLLDGERPRINFRINFLDKKDIRHEVVRRAFCYKNVKQEDVKTKIKDFPSFDICEDVLATPNPRLLKLSSIVENPYFSVGATAVYGVGYSEMTGCYYHDSSGLVLSYVPNQPTNANVKEAKQSIYGNLLADFPFAVEADRANVMGILLVPLVRNLIQGPTPLHAVTAPSPGTGKTLLVNILATVIQGRDVAIMSEAVRDEEWGKKITSKLRELPAIFYIDNVCRKLDSGQLSAAISTTLWEDRFLNVSKMVNYPVHCCWICTGNNIRFSTEMIRRTVPIRLDTDKPKPWTRKPSDFKIPDILKWCKSNRGRLIWALMVLVNNWKAAGMPEPKNINSHLGMFEDYERVIGGILEVNEIEGFLDNLKEFYQLADEEGYILEDFVVVWDDKYGDREVFCMDLLSLVKGNGLLLPIGDGSDHSQLTRLGKFLENAVDRHVGRFVIRKKPGKISGKNAYFLESSICVVKDNGDNQLAPFSDVKK
jgi:hypothetical protein